MIPFGTEVVVTHKLVRIKGFGSRKYDTEPLENTVRGFVCRTVWLKEGKLDKWHEDSPFGSSFIVSFKETKTIKAYEVAWHNTRKPLLVLPEHLEMTELGND